MSVHITKMEELITLLNDNENTLIVVNFFASWCGMCKTIAPSLEELASELAELILVLTVDVDQCKDIADEYDIWEIPTFVLVKNNEFVTQISGANYDQLKQVVQKNK
ncbi:hypothetical protein FQA39_LY08377 [Lamprigera yunnana]|nr:hypothetical protein FQA39_LY08377 [Lamprigera yunnana]